MPLSPEQIATYHREGFLVLRQLIGAPEVAELSHQVDGLHERMAATPAPGVQCSWEEGGQSRRIRQLMNSEVVSPAIDALSRDARLLEPLAQLMGPDIMLFHSKLMMKAARDGSFTPWHQDWGYWQRHSSRPSHINCMLAVDGQDEANGCIRFVPGSHLQGAVAHTDLKTSSFNIGLPGGMDAYPSVPVEMAPGDAVFFGPLVIHGSAPNTSGRDRRANTFAFDVPGNRDPELSPDRIRRGTWRGRAGADGGYSAVR